MNPEVQLQRADLFYKLTHACPIKELIIWLKAYTIGALGIPLDSSHVHSIFSQIDMFNDLTDNGLVDALNSIRIVLHSIDKVPLERRLSPSNRDIKNYQEYVEHFASEVISDPNYFQNKIKELNSTNIQPFSYFDGVLIQEECPICTVELTPESSIYLQCQHVFHLQCLHQHVKNIIENGQTIIKCPDQNCRIQISEQELKNMLTPELEQKYYDFSLNQYVEDHGNCTSWCPTPDCNLVFEFYEGASLFDCKRCCRRYCLKCRCDYHEGMSCQQRRQYMGMSSEDQQFVQMARGAKFKQCPKCKFWVERTRGCPSMKCRCGQDFCYSCGGISCPHGTCINNTPNEQTLRRPM